MPYYNNVPQFYPPIQSTGYPGSNFTVNQPNVQQQNSGIIWVQGENAAKAYPVGAGQSILLMDSEDAIMYIKSTDQSGMPLPLRIFDYKERFQNAKENTKVAEESKQDYISRDEFDKFKSEIRDEIRRRRKSDEQIKESKNA